MGVCADVWAVREGYRRKCWSAPPKAVEWAGAMKGMVMMSLDGVLRSPGSGRRRRSAAWLLSLLVGAWWTMGAGVAVAGSPAVGQVPGSPFATGNEPVSVAFSPGGGLLATANEGASTVSVFSVGSRGVLTRVPVPRSRPAGSRTLWRLALLAGCSRPPTGAPARCRCSR
jgi:hypothetical protein